jgi:hypothetical protein
MKLSFPKELEIPDMQEMCALGLIVLMDVGNENLYFQDCEGKTYFCKCL